MYAHMHRKETLLILYVEVKGRKGTLYSMHLLIGLIQLAVPPYSRSIGVTTKEV